MKSMMMLTLLVFTGLLFGRPFHHAPPDTARQLRIEIIAKEQQELEALKNGRVQEFADLISDDAIFVDSKGTSSKAQVVASLSDLKLLGYEMTDIRFVEVSPQSGIIAYKLTQNGREQGKDFSDTVYASALWANRRAKWVCLFTQESPAQ